MAGSRKTIHLPTPYLLGLTLMSHCLSLNCQYSRTQGLACFHGQVHAALPPATQLPALILYLHQIATWTEEEELYQFGSAFNDLPSYLHFIS